MGQDEIWPPPLLLQLLGNTALEQPFEDRHARSGCQAGRHSIPQALDSAAPDP